MSLFKNVKPIFVARIYFEEGAHSIKQINEFSKDCSDSLKSILKDDYHLIVIPQQTTKRFEEPKFECFYPQDFKSIDFENLKKQFDEAMKDFVESFKKE